MPLRVRKPPASSSASAKAHAVFGNDGEPSKVYPGRPDLEICALSTPKWYFREFSPGDNLSDPDFAKALFTGDSESTAARSLVREALQNSLDARTTNTQKVRVRIAIHRNRRTSSYSGAAPFIIGIKDHLNANENGLTDRPDLNEGIPFLVIEDFGTRGLQGDPHYWMPTGIAANSFFLFFRALGRSAKEGEDRGRWGIGKFVFPMSSRGHFIWGLTIPRDTKIPLLMGRAVLRTHKTDQGQWHPDGHWGERITEHSNLVLPVTDPQVIEQFRDTFYIARMNEPGLSVVIPWLIRDIAAEGVRDAVLGEYFLPLLRGELEVELDEDEEYELLDGMAVRKYAEQAKDRKLRERLALAVMATDKKSYTCDWPVTLPWDKLLIRHEDLPQPLRDKLNENFDEGNAISVRIPVTVGLKKSKDAVDGHITVHLRRADGIGGLRPLIIRDGISLPEDKTKTLFDHVALLVAEGCALATAIGDAETPAHEQMQHELLKDLYKYPKKLVTFVRESASNLVRALRHSEDGDDPFTLASYFPLEAKSGPQRPTTRTVSKGKKPGSDLPSLPPRSAPRFRVSRLTGGFTVTGIPESGITLDELTVIAAYDVRRGNPFVRYRSYDFDLSGPDMPKRFSDCQVVSVTGNRLVVKPSAPDFSFAVTGFDTERDLKLRVNAAEIEL